MTRPTRLWRTAVGAVLLLFATATPVGRADAESIRFETEAYAATTGDSVNCDDQIGGSCFELQGDEESARIVVRDDTASPHVGAAYAFVDEAGGIVSGGTSSFCDLTVVDVPSGAVRLDVMVAAFDPVNCAPDVGTSSIGTIEVTWSLNPQEPEVFDVEPQDCLQPTPVTIGVGGITDDGSEITLEALVLLDGVTMERGRQIMEIAAVPYSLLGIKLVSHFRPVTLEGDDAKRMLGQLRQLVGGEVPRGYDVVHGITATELNASMAECLGGVRFSDRAFSVSVDYEDRAVRYIGGPAPIDGGIIHDRAAKVAAHEIGHIMGAHHHYGNCVEGQDPASTEVASCTIMHPTLTPTAAKFSSLNGAIMRSHADQYARP